jgi:hypothetical protein
MILPSSSWTLYYYEWFLESNLRVEAYTELYTLLISGTFKYQHTVCSSLCTIYMVSFLSFSFFHQNMFLL